MADEVIRVLLVDDIPETRENLRKLLAFESDIEVIGAASTGAQGLEIATQSRPDIVLMDINMPDMDGITATEQLRRVAPGTAVIMMSVQSESDYLRRAMMAGARDFLTKPISGDDLYSTIRRVYDSLAEERERYTPPPSGSPSGNKPRPSASAAQGHIIAVYSPQGGAGVTTIASNIAAAMMSEGTRVLLVDADMQFGDVGLFLNLQPKHTVVDMANSVSDLDEEFMQSVMTTHPSGLKVLMAPTSPQEAEKMKPTDIVEIVKATRTMFDYIIVDMSKRLDEQNLGLLDAADRILLVATQTLPSIKNIRVMLDLFDVMDYSPNKVMLVMNRLNAERAGRAYIPIEAIENKLKRQARGRIPLDERTFLAAVNQGVSVISNDTNKSPAKDLIQLAEVVKRSFAEADEAGELQAEDEAQRSNNTSLLGRFWGGR